MDRKQALTTVRRAIARRLRALKRGDKKGAATALAVARKYRRIAQSLRKVTRVSARGTKFIAQFEGFRGCPYLDAVGVPTIGFGHTKGVTLRSRCISLRQGRALLRTDLSKYDDAVKALPTYPRLKQHQFDALVSFVYNVGPGALGTDTGVGRALRRGRFAEAADQLLRWDKAGGQTLAGLTRRRKAERRLFLTGRY